MNFKELFVSELVTYSIFVYWRYTFLSSSGYTINFMSRSRKQAERNISAGANECKYYDYEEDLAATSESGSWAADEKAGSSDNQILMRKHGELQKR